MTKTRNILTKNFNIFKKFISIISIRLTYSISLKIIAINLIFIFTYNDFAFSYIGPGLGGGIIAAVIGILFAIILAITAVLWIPIKKLKEKLSKKDIKTDEERNGK